MSLIGHPESEHDPILAAFDAAEDDGYPTDEAREEYATLEALVEGLRRDKRGVVNVLEFVYRTTKDPELTEDEIRERIGRVVGKALDVVRGHGDGTSAR